jgi:chemosensory pili system protein ChpA (sensor histidine kinase/response regulator)
LDRSAQHLVEVLLTARGAGGLHKNLQSQLVKLLALANDSVQYITRLRQIQDDYAILENLDSNKINNPSDKPILERYRQGYATINRLLETSLRMSELGAEVGRISQATTESMGSLERNILNLQDTVEESRLVPFKTLAFRARAIVRDLTNRYGKSAVLEVRGEEIELDAGTASKLEPALLHLLRNAFDHGLESPTERVTLGKPEQGKICLFLRRRGNRLAIELKDDGRGIDARTIQQIAEAKKLPLTRTQTFEELLAVICQPGFSSQEKATELSGRGVGMDVVAGQVTRLGGKLSLDTSLGVGTTFHIEVPVPHLLVPCIVLQAGSFAFAIPTEDAISTTIFGNLQATPTNSGLYSWNIVHGKETMPGLHLLEYWQGGSTRRAISDTAIAVCVASPDKQHSVWLLADDLVGQMQLSIEAIPPPLVSPIGLMGVSLNVDGTLMPILEGGALAQWLFAATTNAVVEPTAAPAASPSLAEGDVSHLQQTILVVDDAALMRRRIEASLTGYGYLVYTCADGEEAWNWLQTHPLPNLAITDIEMPNMDGFTLIDRCRQIGIEIPILVISSRLSEEWGKEARRLGATDYLTKGFSTAELINQVKALL